ncbi:MAG: potassium channel protein [Phycisphaerales bacterium]|nr:potassium channel protein [Phycisphaerales bacterium]
MRPQVRLWVSIGAVITVIVASTASYVIVLGQSVADSLYMTVITLTTVGYEEVFPLDKTGRTLTMIIILVGYTALAVALANLVSLVVGGELRAIREGVRMKAKIAELRNHVIVCGYGRMGAQLASQLQRERVPFVAIDRDGSLDLAEQGVLCVCGDATEEGTLEVAGIMHAKALVTCLSSDSDNVFVTLSARDMRPQMTIIARAEQPATERKLKRAGATAVICPQMIGAQKSANILCRPHVVELVDMAAKGVDIEIAQYEIEGESRLVGRRLRDSGIRESAKMMVVAIKHADGSQIFSPGPEERIQAGDQLVLIGPGGQASHLDALE